MASQINTVDSQVILKDATVLTTGIQRLSNSPPLPKYSHSLTHETTNQKCNETAGVMSAIATSHINRQPLEKLSPTHSGELPTEDEADSPTPSSTASEPITDQFSPSTKTNLRSTNDRVKEPLHLKRSSHLKKFGTEDGRTTDEEDLEGVRDDAFAWPAHSTYDEQRY